MNKWVLLHHKVDKPDHMEDHYDFLVENARDCLTWKIFEIPKINGPSIEIIKQDNHRLIWLYREKYTLSNDRGQVQRVDSGTYNVFGDFLDIEDFSLVLNGNILNGKLIKKFNLCQLVSEIN